MSVCPIAVVPQPPGFWTAQHLLASPYSSGPRRRPSRSGASSAFGHNLCFSGIYRMMSVVWRKHYRRGRWSRDVWRRERPGALPCLTALLPRRSKDLAWRKRNSRGNLRCVTYLLKIPIAIFFCNFIGGVGAISNKIWSLPFSFSRPCSLQRRVGDSQRSPHRFYGRIGRPYTIGSSRRRRC